MPYIIRNLFTSSNVFRAPNFNTNFIFSCTIFTPRILPRVFISLRARKRLLKDLISAINDHQRAVEIVSKASSWWLNVNR